MKEQYKRLFNIISITILLIVQTVLFMLFWYGWIVKSNDTAAAGFSDYGNIAVTLIYMLIMVFFTKTLGGYKVGYMKISDICMSQFIAIVCCNVIEYLQISVLLHSALDALPILLLTAVEILIIVPWAYYSRRIYLKMYPPQKMIFVYGERIQRELYDKISSRGDNYNIVASISIKEGIGQICNRIKEYEAVILGDIPAQMRNDIVKYCYSNSIRVYITPKISDIVIMGAEDITLFDTPLLLIKDYGLSGEQLFVKRIMDIFISLVLLIIVSPFMLITAILIKAYDGGPVFYRQERFTRDRKVFQILKFRSMTTDSQKDGARITAKNDSRITPVGRVIRRLHFDEIPQLVNILKGDMSFVGPRPEWVVTTEKYEKAVPEFSFRLRVKAGLTGYAQVFGKYNTTPYDKVKLDLMYIEKYSIWLDIKIILLTFKAIFSKDNSEGVDSNQTTALLDDYDKDVKTFGIHSKMQE